MEASSCCVVNTPLGFKMKTSLWPEPKLNRTLLVIRDERGDSGSGVVNTALGYKIELSLSP
jgi:hypothetical protein